LQFESQPQLPLLQVARFGQDKPLQATGLLLLVPPLPLPLPLPVKLPELAGVEPPELLLAAWLLDLSLLAEEERLLLLLLSELLLVVVELEVAGLELEVVLEAELASLEPWEEAGPSLVEP
jgi:hypothetical protein